MSNLISCPHCAAPIEETSDSCPRCRTPLPASDDITRLAPAAAAAQPEDSTRAAGGASARTTSGRGVTSSSGWLSSSGAIDHGRFQPGSLLGGRYRIVGRLGRGGMGEVFRADDLKLGQPVALKFLPAEVDRDPARLTQLHTEVRMARQVSHPNVCRVYDIDELDGHTFLSMEYVDGEDLASLLRRVGRFPQDRAIEIARQICAGLAAAHDRGVVHRDFKPANVMLDNAGKVRITDFGLAGVAGEAIRAGTPAYMAPEQLAGGEVTARSDIYALGLVLYEVFTGQRALEGRNLAELIHKREQSGITPPTAIVRDLAPEVEAAIMRCLRPEPEMRPASALSVAASLPGGDPLAAALAAGETPSPEMVAAAGSTEAIARRAAFAGAVWIAAALAAIVLMYQRVMLVNRVPMPKPPAALVDRAQEALGRLGYSPSAVGTASGLGVSSDYLNYLYTTSVDPDRWSKLAGSRPESFLLWYRTSPRALVPIGTENNVSGTNPPLSAAGMTLVVIDASGRLAELLVVPEPRAAPDASPPVETNWNALFEAAGLPMSAFTPATPQWVPPVFADERRAWEGRLPDQPDLPARIEASARLGKPISFAITGPWTRSARSQAAAPGLFNQALASISNLVMPALMLVGALLARRNVRLERGDRQGAFRTAAVVFGAGLISWTLGATHYADLGIEVQRTFDAVARALFDAGVMWLTYLGIEPYVRRHAPDSLIGWTRLIAGRWSDPRVAADVLVGISAGLAMTLLFPLYTILPPLFGRLEPMPSPADPRLLAATRYLMSGVVGQISSAVTSGMLATAGIIGLLLILKRRWAAFLAGVICYTPVVVNGMFTPGYPLLSLALGAGIISILIGVIFRFGLLAAAAALATHFMLLRAPLTTELASWRGTPAIWYLAVIGGAGFAACYFARRPAMSSPRRVLAHEI